MNKLVTEIENMITELGSIVELLYKQDKENAYAKLNYGILSLSNVIDSIHLYSTKNTDYSFDANKLVSALTEGLNAMELNDLTLLADIINYEVIEQLRLAKNI